jgi:vacuolar-type H+-ATPase subunit I/STV1
MEEIFYHHPFNPNTNYYEPYDYYESYEPKVYYDYYEPPSEEEVTISIIAELTQKLNERLESMENQMNERFDKLEGAMGQIAKEVKELQSEEVSISTIVEATQKLNERLETMESQMNERFDNLERVMCQLAEDVKGLQLAKKVVSKPDSLTSIIPSQLNYEVSESIMVVEDLVDPPIKIVSSLENTDDYFYFRPLTVEEARVLWFLNSKTFPKTRLTYLCHQLQLENTKVWHEQHLFLDPG